MTSELTDDAKKYEHLFSLWAQHSQRACRYQSPIRDGATLMLSSES